MNPISPIPDSPPAGPEPAAPAYVIVTQVKSNRVVYFTDDPEFEPAMEGDWYYVTQHAGALPAAMTLRNCWRWRFNGGVFTDAKAPKAKTPAELLIEANRKALRGILKEKMNALRAGLLPKGTLGTVIRARKLEQARAFLEQPDAEADYRLLQGVAQARAISMHDAARLVIDKAADAQRVLEETELEFERLAYAIRSAKTQEELLALRSELLDEVQPALSAKMKFKVANTTPVDLDQPMKATHRVHEQARLRAQLRLRINKARADACGDYLGNELLRSRREAQARHYLQHGAEPEGEALGLLRSHAEAHQLELRAAAEAILAQARRAEQLLERTEADKDRLLARIASIQSLRDVREAEAQIKALRWDEAHAAPEETQP